MRVELYCKDEGVTPWKSKLGQEHKPLTLLLDDPSVDDPLKELIELRIEDDAEKEKVMGKCKGHRVMVGIHRIGKFNGIARIDGRVVSILDAKK